MDINEDVPEEELHAEITTCEYVCNIMTHPFLPDDILTKVDRSSMLTSLEVRAPWLDPAIIDFSFQEIP